MDRRNTRVGTWAPLGMGAVLLSITGPLSAQSLEPTWTLPSDGSWQPDNVALGAGGSEVFSEYGFYENRKVLLSSYDANPPTPVWNHDEVQWNQVRRVDSSARGTVHAALHQEYVDDTLTWKRPVLNKYSSGSTDVDWSFTSDVLISSQDTTDVFVSADGSRIVSTVFEVSSARTIFYVFDSSSPTPLHVHAVDTGGDCAAMVMSEDGRRMATRAAHVFKVVELDTGSVLYSKYFFGSVFHGGLGISGDGGVVAMASGGALHVFHGVGSTYAAPIVRATPPGSFAPEVAVSEDGEVVAQVMNYFASPGHVRVQVLASEDLVSLIDHHITAPGSVPNTVAGLELSADGGVTAVGVWGDEGGTCPEILIFDIAEGGLSRTADLPGSVVELDLSPDGRHLAVAGKGVHATELGSGGGLYLFATGERDFTMHGVPRSGGSVVFSQPLGEGGVGRVMGSLAVADEPRLINGMGYLRLDETSMFFLQGTATAGADGIAWTETPVTGDPQFVGVTVYLQGLGLRPRTLSEDLVQMTILP